MTRMTFDVRLSNDLAGLNPRSEADRSQARRISIAHAYLLLSTVMHEDRPRGTVEQFVADLNKTAMDVRASVVAQFAFIAQHTINNGSPFLWRPVPIGENLASAMAAGFVNQHQHDLLLPWPTHLNLIASTPPQPTPINDLSDRSVCLAAIAAAVALACCENPDHALSATLDFYLHTFE